MITIRNNEDLRKAYMFLSWGDECDYKKEIKRKIRKYTHQTSDRRLVRDRGDSYVLLITLPDFIGSEEDAREYFMAEEYIEPYYTYYDCTGRPFTHWYRVFERNGRWIAYHSIGLDV